MFKIIYPQSDATLYESSPTTNTGLDEILDYRKKNPNCKIIYRVNECDIKREVSINLEPLLVKAITEAGGLK